MSDAERQKGFTGRPHGAEPLAEFPSELVSSEPVRQSSVEDAVDTGPDAVHGRDAQDSLTPDVLDEPLPPIEFDEPLAPIEQPVDPSFRVRELLAAAVDLTWLVRLLTRSRDA